MNDLKVGDCIKIIEASKGAYGANGYRGIVVDRNTVNSYYGLFEENPGYFVKLLDEPRCNQVWNIGLDIKYEKLNNEGRELKMEKVIKDFVISKDGKGVKVNFEDGTYKKVYAVEPDEFDLRRALYLSLAKKFEHEFKYEDIEKVADAIAMMKVYIKEVEGIVAKYENEKEVERIIANKRAKRAAYKKRRTIREHEEKIEIQKEAYLRAMREMTKIN